MIRFDLATSQRRRDKKSNTKDNKKATMKRLHKQLQPNMAAAAAGTDEDDHNGESMPVKRAKIGQPIGAAETTNASQR